MALDLTILNLVLLLVELILLGFTVLLLILGRREERTRRMLIGEVAKTAKMISRQEYFNEVVFGIEKAQTEIVAAVTGTRPNDESIASVDTIIAKLRNKSKSGVKVRYILPKTIDRLYMARRYKESGAEVRFHHSVTVSDTRYMVVDRRYTIIGLPARYGENEPTRQGYVIPAEGLASLLREHFEEVWVASDTYETYVSEVIKELKSHSPTISTKLLAEQISLDEEEVEQLAL
jgi:hypothetical protein